MLCIHVQQVCGNAKKMREPHWCYVLTCYGQKLTVIPLTSMDDYSRQFKAEDRDKRCSLPGKSGKLTRCPECNKYSE